VELVTTGWGNQPAQAHSNPLYTASNPAKAMDVEEVAQVLRALDVPFAVGHLPKEDYGHTTRSRAISCLRRFDMANPRLRGNTLEETFQLRSQLLRRHGIELAANLARHVSLAAADPYRR
jgi:hypothetical protein